MASRSYISSNFSRFAFLGTASLFLFCQACTLSNELSPKENERAKIAFESCLICHSVQEMQRGPIIDGLPAWYTQHQLEKFQSGIRGQNPKNRSEHLMGSAKDRFADAETIDLLARYIESIAPQTHLSIVRGDAAKGAIAYFRCIPCHGSKGEGNALLKSPPLNIQEDWYLLDQLRKFSKGIRGSHPEDLTGQQMTVALNGIDDPTFKDLIAYIQLFQK